jgi:predicted dehydrogenase
MVGFNRRFSPHMVETKKWLTGFQSAKAIIITVNAGAIPADHWTQDLKVGGGRIIGEACHFIDLARFLADAPIVSVHAVPMGGGEGSLGDCVTIQLKFANDSIASIHYLANGNKSFPKERIEVFGSGKVIVCDNFRVTREIGGRGKLKTRSQDKGHANELAAFVDSISKGSLPPISTDELIEVSRVTLDVAKLMQDQLA